MKAFIEETGSHEVRQLLRPGAGPASSRLAYVECHSAFARLERDRYITRAQAERAAAALRERWADVAVVELDEMVMLRASELVRAHTLRGADGIHLASAQVLASRTSDVFEFVCWDKKLRAAASALGMSVGPAATS